MRSGLIIVAGMFAAGASLVALAQPEPQENQAGGASGASLAQSLTQGLPCSSGRAKPALDERIQALAVTMDDLRAALTEISKSSETCSAVRSAASDIAEGLAGAADSLAAEIAAQEQAVAALVPEAFAEAERRAAEPAFESLPPPRNLTRGRATAP